MYLVEVIPITKGMSKEHLSYFTSQALRPGTLVTVPLGARTVNAVVASIEDVKHRKSEIRSAGHTIKKIKSIRSDTFLDEGIIRAAQETARYFATITGRILHSIIPAAIQQAPPPAPHPQHEPSGPIPEAYVLQTQPEERFSNYKSLIREEFANKRSVIFCLPTIEDVNEALQTLQKGIDQYTITIHGNLTKQELRQRFEHAVTAEHPVLIVGTPMAMTVPRPDVGAFILERESADSYVQTNAPFIDMRIFAEFIHRERGARLLIGDTLLRVDTLWRCFNMELTEYMPLKFRSLTAAHTSLVDMRRTENNQIAEAPSFRILSDELYARITSAIQNNERVFLFASRRGLAPVTVCGDCGTPATCPYCIKPLVLHTTRQNTEMNFFRCHTCTYTASAHTTCESCGSWRLTDLGIGVERVVETLGNDVDPDRLFILDKDHTRTQKQARTAMEAFIATPGAILIGTDMAVRYLTEEVETSAVVSLDSLFSVPDFRITERIMNLITTMRTFTSKQFVIQSRDVDQPVLQYGAAGNLIDFYRTEIDLREMLGYPPFTILIKITRRGHKQRVEKDIRALERELQDEQIVSYVGTPHKGRYVKHALLRVPREQWVDEDIRAFLRALPPQFIVSINPREIL